MAAHGLLINIMCVMHMKPDYGVVLLEQNHKQTVSTVKNFALYFAKHFPFTPENIETHLQELITLDVLKLHGDKLWCKRMVNDNKISELRAEVGSKGGSKSIGKTVEKVDFARAKPLAKVKAKQAAKSDIEINTENEIKETIKKVVEYLNLKAGKAYRTDGANTKYIRARLEEGYSFDDFTKVVDIKCDEWLGGRMEQYLRIATLFIPAHFEDYLNQKKETKINTPVKQSDDIKYE